MTTDTNETKRRYHQAHKRSDRRTYRMTSLFLSGAQRQALAKAAPGLSMAEAIRAAIDAFVQTKSAAEGEQQ